MDLQKRNASDEDYEFGENKRVQGDPGKSPKSGKNLKILIPLIIGIAIIILQIILLRINPPSFQITAGALSLLTAILGGIFARKPQISSGQRISSFIISTISAIIVYLGPDTLISSIALFTNEFIFGAIFFAALREDVKERILGIKSELTRISAILMIFYIAILFFYTPIRLNLVNLYPGWDMSIRMLVGIGFICLSFFTYKTARYRISFFGLAGLLILWYTIFADWILRNWERMQVRHVITFGIVLITTIFLATSAGLSFGYFIGESIALLKDHKCILLGRMFESPLYSRISPIAQIKSAMKRNPVLFDKVKRSIILLTLLFIISLPGAIGALTPKIKSVEIRPRDDYDIKFNFWASSNLDGDYTPEMIRELNEHRVNLDLGIPYNLQGIETLKRFEDLMPNITYRTTITPPHNFGELTGTIRNATEILLPYIQNGTLDQWRGFAFDIEGDHYRWWLAFDNYNDAIREWEKAFDYIENVSQEFGFKIEMEDVGSNIFETEVRFDGDYDNQMIEGYVDGFPQRFTTYAPMVYRCMTDFKECTTCSPNMLNPWYSSYKVYQELYTLNNTLPPGTVGIYLGITNCTCYSRDLAQPEEISWGEPTGFGNLIRDTLIAKHFGVKEVTYFLLWSIDTPKKFGVFDSYGINFLDILNESVNTAPPESFRIYYTYYDSDLPDEVIRDVLGDFSAPALAWLPFIFPFIYGLLKIKVGKKNKER